MIEAVIRWSMDNRFLVVLLSLGAAAAIVCRDVERRCQRRP